MARLVTLDVATQVAASRVRGRDRPADQPNRAPAAISTAVIRLRIGDLSSQTGNG